jgi:sugar-phosphatase
MLFDLDGVLVDSRTCIELVWHAWAAERGFDPAPFLRVAHGRRISETIRLVRPDLDAVAETRVLDAMEAVETRGLHPVPGAVELVARLSDTQWAVVTSGSRVVATLRLRTAGLPIPRVFITADDVRRGKPDPEGYLLAAARLSVTPRDCLVFEDSPTGLAAGQAAGMPVIAVLTTHPPTELAGAVSRLDSLAALRLDAGPAGLSLGF